MQFLRNLLDSKAPLFEKGGKLEKYHAIFEMHDTISGVVLGVGGMK